MKSGWTFCEAFSYNFSNLEALQSLILYRKSLCKRQKEVIHNHIGIFIRHSSTSSPDTSKQHQAEKGFFDQSRQFSWMTKKSIGSLTCPTGEELSSWQLSIRLPPRCGLMVIGGKTRAEEDRCRNSSFYVVNVFGEPLWRTDDVWLACSLPFYSS